MEAIQQVVVCPVAKVSVKRKTKTNPKTREQRLAEEPCCPVCLEELTDETLSNPIKCHNICVDCMPVCKNVRCVVNDGHAREGLVRHPVFVRVSLFANAVGL